LIAGADAGTKPIESAQRTTGMEHHVTANESNATTLTVVLVHGAFADASSWTGVINELQSAGVHVLAPPNPLRGVAADAAYITSFVGDIDGPVLLVGHSYAGAVITQAGTDAHNVVGLVFVAAFAPEAGETLADINARYPDVPLAGALHTFALTQNDGKQGTETYVDLAKFRDAFCADLPEERARVAAVTQRTTSLDAFTAVVTGTPAWRTLPSWAIIALADHAIHPDAERDMAKRAGSESVEIDSSHLVMVSQPTAVTDVVLRALKAVRQ
jgi:pimeloyl-ACP methyl ester carboxylesterase